MWHLGLAYAAVVLLGHDRWLSAISKTKWPDLPLLLAVMLLLLLQEAVLLLAAVVVL